ncbi:hypothetical protein [uncultured Dysosmobacter sp.]|uniref:hypothetical protein n=1 Tax=uncultured Dysosmobacter sp. TaxID=2591384 RepID=UPI0026711E12|nr:hypothetical protein [uncultured Dysosmobacter sp.]
MKNQDFSSRSPDFFEILWADSEAWRCTAPKRANGVKEDGIPSRAITGLFYTQNQEFFQMNPRDQDKALPVQTLSVLTSIE